MKHFPSEFEELLTARGRRVLAGKDAELCGALAHPERRFLAASGLISKQKAASCRKLLQSALGAHLVLMEEIIPPGSIWDMTEDYGERLPKVVRVQTALLENRRERGHRAAEEVGLNSMLKSESFRAFAEALSGRKLRPRWGTQVLCYGPGDYSGPHNDHHPEEKLARKGYLDVHLSFTAPSVQHHYLVYAKGGHFGELEEVSRDGLVTAYRLPFWHYTTPLVAKPGRESTAQRWVMLGTFLFA